MEQQSLISDSEPATLTLMRGAQASLPKVPSVPPIYAAIAACETDEDPERWDGMG